MPSRWDYLLDTRPVPLFEFMIEEVSKLISNDLGKWPLPVQELDLAPNHAFVPLLSGATPRPDPRVFRESFKLARWDLAHETNAYDDYMRNQRWAEAGLAPADKPALLFVSRWLLDQVTSLREATASKVKTPQLLEILERTERRLFAPSL